MPEVVIAPPTERGSRPENPTDRQTLIRAFNSAAIRWAEDVDHLHRSIDPRRELEDLADTGILSPDQEREFSEFRRFQKGLRALTGESRITLYDQDHRSTITTSFKNPATGNMDHREEGLDISDLIDNLRDNEAGLVRLLASSHVGDSRKNLERVLSQCREEREILERNSLGFTDIYPHALAQDDPVEEGRLNEEERRVGKDLLASIIPSEGNRVEAKRRLSKARLLFIPQKGEQPRNNGNNGSRFGRLISPFLRHNGTEHTPSNGGIQTPNGGTEVSPGTPISPTEPDTGSPTTEGPDGTKAGTRSSTEDTEAERRSRRFFPWALIGFAGMLGLISPGEISLPNINIDPRLLEELFNRLRSGSPAQTRQVPYAPSFPDGRNPYNREIPLDQLGPFPSPFSNSSTMRPLTDQEWQELAAAASGKGDKAEMGTRRQDLLGSDYPDELITVDKAEQMAKETVGIKIEAGQTVRGIIEDKLRQADPNASVEEIDRRATPIVWYAMDLNQHIPNLDEVYPGDELNLPKYLDIYSRGYGGGPARKGYAHWDREIDTLNNREKLKQAAGLMDPIEYGKKRVRDLYKTALVDSTVY